MVIALVVGAAVLAYTYFSSAPAVDSPAAAQQPPAIKPFPVQTVIARRGTLTQSISATGDILAEARVEVFPKIAGHLEELNVEEGDAVRAGQVIGRIANAESRVRVAKAAAEVEALQAEWAQMQSGALPEEIAQSVDAVEHTRAELANAEGFADRTRGMVERGLQSTQELDDATRRLRQARATHTAPASACNCFAPGRALRLARRCRPGCARRRLPTSWPPSNCSTRSLRPPWTVLSAIATSIAALTSRRRKHPS